MIIPRFSYCDMDEETRKFVVDTCREAYKRQHDGELKYYKDLAIQPVEYIHANNIPYMEGNVIKYVTRWRDKNGVADLLKARHYIDLLLELEEKAE